ncbi:hypothetical protein [Aeromonas jandaei]|uniref:hypothetical protein n=1 Tax=Aeromonas jandaei TaxID=650 RepID=UPI00162424F9|nr:hypothetical protein [Aeromonas jandaei]
MENHTDIKPIGQVWDEAELEEVNAWSRSHHSSTSCRRSHARRREVIPATLPRLVASLNGTFLVYCGMRLPITTEQAISRVTWMQQHLRDVALAEQFGKEVRHG